MASIYLQSLDSSPNVEIANRSTLVQFVYMGARLSSLHEIIPYLRLQIVMGMEIKATEFPDLGSIVLHLRHACTEGRTTGTFPNKYNQQKGRQKVQLPVCEYT